jgi:imidazolonepropionase-like amidohydrolase
MGTAQRGKVADLIAVSSDPLRSLEVLREPTFVMACGRFIGR